MAYQALMLSGVPNFVFTVGYTNASWTLKVDLVAEFTCRLLAHLAATATAASYRCATRRSASCRSWTSRPATCCGPSTSCPRQGDREPWRLRQSYLHDRRTIRSAALDDGVLHFH